MSYSFFFQVCFVKWNLCGASFANDGQLFTFVKSRTSCCTFTFCRCLQTKQYFSLNVWYHSYSLLPLRCCRRILPRQTSQEVQEDYWVHSVRWLFDSNHWCCAAVSTKPTRIYIECLPLHLHRRVFGSQKDLGNSSYFLHLFCNWSVQLVLCSSNEDGCG